MKRNYLILQTICSICLMFSALYAQTPNNNSSQNDPTYNTGELVEAADYRGAWYKSQIKEVKDDKYRVHFFGWGDTWDEWVTSDKIRYSDDYEFGREVEVSQNGVWYKALLVDNRYGTEHLVSYVGYNEEEWVKDERIREVGSIGGGYRSGGKIVEALDGKIWRRAVILKRRYREVYIHYEGFDDVWNAWISTDKIRQIR